MLIKILDTPKTKLGGQMIIWLNGSFGSGKTSVANALSALYEKAHIYDPEEVGQFIRANVPEGKVYSDFQDHPLWRKMNFDVLKHSALTSKVPIIVPMTIVNDIYYNEIINALKKAGIDIRLYTLYANEEILHKRLAQRGDEPGSWSFDQVSRCCEYLEKETNFTKIDSEQHSIDAIAKMIFKNNKI